MVSVRGELFLEMNYCPSVIANQFDLCNSTILFSSRSEKYVYMHDPAKLGLDAGGNKMADVTV